MHVLGYMKMQRLSLKRLNELAPDNSAVKTNQGNLYFLQKEYNKAIEFYSQATELDNEDGGIWINLSMAQYRAGEYKAGENQLSARIEIERRFRKRV